MSTTPVERGQWVAVGADKSAQDTYASIKAALKDIASRHGLDIFLQGSYANHTNIRADSDVDIVVMTTHTYKGSLERLSAQGKVALGLKPRATYTSYDLRQDVHRALLAYYGASYVEPRNKCIKVKKRPGYVDADVVPCVEYHYYPYGSSGTSQYTEGIFITPRSGASIVNFPKEHIRNGHVKNYLCDLRYKPTVRQVKRLRNRAVDEGRLRPEDAPGYLLECMTYNVPNDKFVVDDAQRLWDVVLWLHVSSSKSSFRSCDGIHTLFGSDPGGFSVGKAEEICKALWDAV